jgi:hypothetical protein
VKPDWTFGKGGVRLALFGKIVAVFTPNLLPLNHAARFNKALSPCLNKISSISARGALWPSDKALQSSFQDKLHLTSYALIKKGM